MKVRLTIDLELPEKFEEWPDLELSQFLFDSYVNYVTLQHYVEALHWAASAQLGSENEVLMDKLAHERHIEAARFSKPVEWKFDKL